ncbi:SCAN domain-containing protein 3 [Trichinella zimbabwensis]|uniref:SCAN domain-containing protein 3 n=1 Tax=Trichinella zimbabwensis TaxID=268475 RepID=A0A0V1HYL8_9BILA|nr:SCAN domain-containing protein 3 [Trichinella zimbabwensis]
MAYLNYFTKFSIFSPLKSKRAEVASKLLEIFFTFSSSGILESDNGRVFSNAIIAELKTYWPELKLVTCTPRVKVTFGEEPPIGMESYVLPKSLVDAVKREEEIEEFLISQEANDEESLNRDGKNYEENERNIMKHLPETFIKARKEAAAGQSRSAAKMTRRSIKMLKPLHIGQNTTLRVPDVDYGLADPKNFLVVVMAESEGLYTVGCREGKLASKFTAADLQVIPEMLLSIDEVPDDEIPFRTAVTKATGDQGYVKCMCLSGCSSGRCSCSRKRVLCSSRCHPGKSCKNI